MIEPYKVVWSRPAKRAIAEELPESVAAAAVEMILGPLRENPRQIGKPLRAPLSGVYSARRATYRVLFRIDDDRHVIVIDTIRHRSAVYR